jgi:acetyl-CoA carboxylase biotin carboxyl carrier protein
MVGRVVEVVIPVGSRVEAAEELVIIESMKMEIPVAAPAAGTITMVHVSAGDAVQENDLLVTLES